MGGWYNSQLTPQGRLDARLVAEELMRRCRDTTRPVRITTSDLSRCAETAEILAARLGAPVTEDARLREISFGEAEGKSRVWLADREVSAPDHDRLDYRGPIAGAETRREVATRVGDCVRELMADGDHTHVVVTHGFAQIFVITTWLQIPVESAGFLSFAPKPGSITHLQHDDYWRNRTVAALAETSHLKTG